MFKPNLKLYMTLIVILIILFILVAVFSYPKRKEEEIEKPTIPAPTSFPINFPTIIHPTSTGGSEDVPPETLNFAIQKQNLKKRTPLTQNGFTIAFDYADDMFIVNLVEPKDINRQVFEDWLKENYPLIPLNKFIFK